MNRSTPLRSPLLLGALVLLGPACDDGKPPADTLEVPSTYTFESRFVPGTSAVSHEGQVLRHVLIEDLDDYIGALTPQIDGAQFMPTSPDEVIAALDYYFRFDSEVSGENAPRLSPTPDRKQARYDDIATDKDLVGKIAGNDSATDSVDYKNGGFKGWSDTAITAHGGALTSPEGFVTAMFSTIAKQAADRVAGQLPLGPDGKTLPVHVTPSGIDLRELTQKFLLGAVTFHQAADDYLDDAQDGKGLRASNLAPSDTSARWTELEHHWDEGFGYFGAAMDMNAYTDEELAGRGGRAERAKGYCDSNEDGAIDLLSEFNFGHSVALAKRDFGARPGGETDFTKEAFDAFLRGRAIIHHAAGRALTDDEYADLIDQRDIAIGAWEKGLAASAVHYINETLAAMARFGTGDYVFVDHAKAWSEMKGYALSLQFNPHSPLAKTAFADLHARLGDKPALPTDEAATITAYKQNLIAARAVLMSTYGLPSANTGDDSGAGGW